MACRIPYIDNYYTDSTKLTTARALHIEIGKKLREATDTDGDTLFPIQKGYVVLNNTPELRQQQDVFINNLKAAYGDQVVFVLPKQYNGNDAVGIDVRYKIGANEENVPIDTIDDEDIRIFGVDEVQGSIQTEIINEYDRYIDEDIINKEETTTFFEGVLERITDSLRQYGKLLKEGVVDSPDFRVKVNKIQQQIINLNKDELSTGAAIGNYVVQTTQWLDSIFNTFFRDDNNVQRVFQEVKELSARKDSLTEEELEELNDKIKWVSRQINKSTHYMYLFNDLINFRKELTAQGYEPYVDNSVKRSSQFYKDLNNLLNHNYDSNVLKELRTIEFTQASKAEIEELLKSDSFTAARITNLILQLARQDNPTMTVDAYQAFTKQVESTINAHKSKSVDVLLREAEAKVERLKTELQKLHYDVIEEWLWPVIEEKQKDYDGALKITKEQFKTQLRTLDKDEGFFKHQLDATVQSNDPLTAAIALVLGNQLYDAHQSTIVESQDLTDERELLELEKNMSRDEINTYHDEMTHEQLYASLDQYGNLEEVEADYEGDKIQLNVFGRTVWIKAQKKKAFLSEYNEALFDAHQSYFYQHLNKEIRKLFSLLPVDEKGVPDLTVAPKDTALYKFLASSNDPVDKQLFKKLYYTKNGKTSYNKYAVKLEYPYTIWNLMKTAHLSNFYQQHKDLVTGDKRVKLIEELGLDAVNGKKQLPKNLQKHVSIHYVGKDEDPTFIKKQLLAGKYEHIASYEKNNAFYVLVLKNGTLEWVDIYNNKETLKDITAYYTLRGDFSPLKQSYHYTQSFDKEVVNKWNKLKSDSKKEKYFNTLLKHYNRANQRAGNAGLKYNILPQVEKLKNFADYTAAANVKSTWDKLVEWFRRVIMGDDVNITPQEQKDTAYQEQYLNGEPVLKIPIRFITHINDELVEQDLYRSVMMYAASANTYNHLRQVEPQIQVLKRIINPDAIVGIGRQAKDYDAFDKLLVRFGKKHNVTAAERLNKKLTEFINDTMYGQDSFGSSVDVLGFKLDIQKAANKISKYTALTSLAWNISSMFTNLGIGTYQNYAETIGKGMYSKEEFRDALLIYGKSVTNMEFFKDLTQPNFAKKSIINQLAIFFDAIQGEFLDDQGNISRTGNAEKMANRAMFWTQAAPEHQMQLSLMIAMMKGYKLPSGKSLWDSVQHKPGEMFTFPAEVTDKVLRDFRNKLHSTNKKLHGHFAKLDKAVVQRRWYGKLLIMFKKHLYANIRHRFGAKRFDWEAGVEHEGYIRSYFTMLLEDANQQKGLVAKVLFGARNFLVKPYLGVFDQLIGGQLSKRSPELSAFMYGTEEQQVAAKKAAFDMMIVSVLAIMIIALEAALDDDDEEGEQILKLLEAQAIKLEGDIGMYLPFFVSPRSPQIFTTVDKATQLITSPFAQMRAYTTSVKVLSQLWTDVGPYGTVWTEGGFEQYDRSGAGYKKGDYKITRALSKSILSPFWQITRFMTPDEQLQYLNLSRKNSR